MPRLLSLGGIQEEKTFTSSSTVQTWLLSDLQTVCHNFRVIEQPPCRAVTRYFTHVTAPPPNTAPVLHVPPPEFVSAFALNMVPLTVLYLVCLLNTVFSIFIVSHRSPRGHVYRKNYAPWDRGSFQVTQLSRAIPLLGVLTKCEISISLKILL